MEVSAILVAGGSGKRFESSLPKQFVLLDKLPVIHYSFEALSSLKSVKEMIVVCDPLYHSYLPTSKNTCFALPGKERQDSVYNGLICCSCPYILIHDAARPFPPLKATQEALNHLTSFSACSLGRPISFTLKECNSQNLVEKTLPREKLWEVQTPQVFHRKWLLQAFNYAKENNLKVTDEAALIEAIKKSVLMVEGSPYNLKITCPKDLQVAKSFLAWI